MRGILGLSRSSCVAREDEWVGRRSQTQVTWIQNGVELESQESGVVAQCGR